MQDLPIWQQRLGPLLAPPAALHALALRARAALYARGLLPAWTPPAPAVCVGGPNPLARGKVMLSAWLLGWAKAKGLNPALLARPAGASAADMPLSVLAATTAFQCGVDAALLARYRPGAVILADVNPVRAGKSAWKAVHPDLFVLHDFFPTLSIRRSADLVLLGACDLDKGWNRPFPAGSWREGGKALERASAFVLHMRPDELPPRGHLAERRLGRFGKPVFTVHQRIWRLRSAAGGTARDLGGEPYLLVAAQSNHASAAKAAKDYLGAAPRLEVIFPDSHRFTQQDQAQIASDATRMRAPHVLATPDAALRLEAVPGLDLWTFDPDVVFGPCLMGGQTFTPWWESLWTGISPMG
jgi:tetraacyldisaccharide 4'-kinase